jgi:hypothetical protein
LTPGPREPQGIEARNSILRQFFPRCQEKSRGVFVRSLVKAKLLLGWMPQHEALRILNRCYFENHLSDRNAIKLWRGYRDKVSALAPRNPIAIPRIPFTEAESQAIQAHQQRILSGPNARYFQEVIKIHPGDLVAHQLDVVIEQSEKYAPTVPNEQLRINTFLGVGLEFNGPYVPKRTSRTCVDIDLPHFEFVPIVRGDGSVDFKERDRYVQVVPTPNNRLLLWGGYHRTHTVLCQLGGDAAAVAPLLTVMRGIAEVDRFFSRSSPRRDAVLGECPPLLRDFLDEELFITVNLQKTRAVGRVEEIRPGRFRAGVIRVNDDS